MPYGTPNDVRREVGALLEMGRSGGYIAAPAHDVPGDARPENVAAMVELFREEAARYAPDLVLVGFYVANDVRNNSRELETRMWEGTNIKVSSRPFLRATPDRFEISQMSAWRVMAQNGG